MFPTTLQLLVEVQSCTRGIFWRKCSLNDCSVLYFSDIKWFQKHFEAATYCANNPKRMYYEVLSTGPLCIALLKVSITYYGPYKSDTFKTVCNHLLHTFLNFSSLESLQKQRTEVKPYIKSCMNCKTNFIHGKFTQILFTNVHYFNSSVAIASGIQAEWPRNQCWLPQGADTYLFLHKSCGLLSLLSIQHWRLNPWG